MRTSSAAFLAIFLALAGVAAAAGAPDGATIRNTGSTNFLGYTIKVWSDGHATAVHAERNGRAADRPVSGTIPASMVSQFFNDLHTARKSRPVSQPCVKSASFGTATIVQYHGWTSPDLECGGDGTVIALGSDAKKIAAHLQVQGTPIRRIPMLPNEPRRTEPTPSQPGATPEPASSVSYLLPSH